MVAGTDPLRSAPLARLALAIIAALFFLAGGAQMREQSSGIPFPFGLLAHGAAFAVLSHGVSGLRDQPGGGPKAGPRPPRSFYEDDV